jgi:TP901 family phage tail tape measure protein
VPVSSRDLLLRMIAIDAASRPIRQVAGATRDLARVAASSSIRNFGQYLILTRAGRGLEEFGRRIMSVAKDTHDMALEFGQQMNYVRTQTDLTDKQFARLSEHAVALLGQIPQPFEQITEGLYDIFSSTDVNLGGALKLIQAFSTGATAGFTDIRTVARSVIAEMNAFNRPVSDVNRLLDIQFQMVRFGVGTYEEFANALGDVIPPAAAANQKIETFSGALAFLTRQGLSTSKAAISVARAIDLIVRPENIKNIEDFGVEVVDSAGRFRQLNDIILDFNKAMADMTPRQRIEALKEMFGEGEIRAMRFFKVAIPNAKDFNRLVGQMGDSAGATQDAFEKMSASPAVQMKIIANAFRSVALQIYQSFLPALSTVVDALSVVVKWFRELSPETKRLIGLVVIFAGAISLVSGRILIMLGLLKGTLSIMQLAGLTFKSSIAIIGGVILAVTALAIAGYLIIKNWEKVRAWWDRNWAVIRQVAAAAIGMLVGLFILKIPLLVGLFVGGMAKIVKAVKFAMFAIKFAFLTNPIGLLVLAVATAVGLIILNWGKVKRVTMSIWSAVWGFLKRTWQSIKTTAISVWNAVVDFFQKVGNWLYRYIVTPVGNILGAVARFGKALLGVLETIFAPVIAVVQISMAIISTIFAVGLGAIRIAWAIFSLIFMAAWQLVWGTVKMTAELAWIGIQKAWELTIRVLRAIWDRIGDPLIATLKTVWSVVKAIWQGWWAIITTAWNLFLTTVKVIWNSVLKPFIDVIQGVWSGVSETWKGMWRGLKNFFVTLWNDIKGVVYGAVNFIIAQIDRLKRILTGDLIGDFGRQVGELARAGQINVPGGQRGFRNFPGGLAWVGEAGRELMYVPRGASVIPHAQSEQLAAGGSVHNTWHIYGTNMTADELMDEVNWKEKTRGW